MGADFWQNFTSYREDLSQAMRDLQETVLESGNFRMSKYVLNFNKDKQIKEAEQELAAWEKEKEEELRNDMIYECKRNIKYLQNLSDPVNFEDKIELARYLCGADSTCSILDFNGFSNTFDYGKITPLNKSQLLEIFKTDKPNHKQVLDKDFELSELCDRLQGVCLVVYKDNQPDEIFFAGYSAD